MGDWIDRHEKDINNPKQQKAQIETSERKPSGQAGVVRGPCKSCEIFTAPGKLGGSNGSRLRGTEGPK